MRFAHILNYIVPWLIVVFIHGYALAGELNRDYSKTLAVVPVKSGNVDKNVYRQFDRLVPVLKKVSKNKIVKLEYRYSGQPGREQDVENAYKLAGHIEKYLRVRHKLDLDLWVAIDITPKFTKTPPVLTIAVIADDMKKLEAVLINPPKN
ncbi:MAG: hypothetical protein PVSMB11_06810 [Desulfuromonadaceae bacterium]